MTLKVQGLKGNDQAQKCHRVGHRAHEDGRARLGRNPLKSALGDVLHAVMCGAGHNLRLILAALRFYCARIGWSVQAFTPHQLPYRISVGSHLAENEIF